MDPGQQIFFIYRFSCFRFGLLRSGLSVGTLAPGLAGFRLFLFNP